MRVAGNKEGKGGKAMVMATRVVHKRTAMATKRVMATKTRLGAQGAAMTDLCMPHNNEPNHDHDGNNNNDGHCWTQQSTVGVS